MVGIMANHNELLGAYEKLLDDKEEDLLAQQTEILKFVDTKHKVEATKEYLRALRQIDVEINAFIKSLLKLQKKSPDFKDKAKALCERSRRLKDYTRDMHKTLSDDLSEKHIERGDLATKVGFIAAMALAAVSLAKHTVDPDSTHSALEASSGATLGVTIVHRKKIGSSIKALAKSVCSAPQDIKDSFVLYFAKEKAKEIGKRLASVIANDNKPLAYTPMPYYPKKKKAKRLHTCDRL